LTDPFLTDSWHFVPGYYRAVPAGQKPFPSKRFALAFRSLSEEYTAKTAGAGRRSIKDRMSTEIFDKLDNIMSHPGRYPWMIALGCLWLFLYCGSFVWFKPFWQRWLFWAAILGVAGSLVCNQRYGVEDIVGGGLVLWVLFQIVRFRFRQLTRRRESWPVCANLRRQLFEFWMNKG
jgi:hypothetical protein